MKSAESKSVATPVAKTAQPFFSKGGKDSFFKPNTTPVQTKLNIGEPNDKYEKEADAVAEKVVQKMGASQPSPAPSSSPAPAPAAAPAAPVITPLIQEKANTEELQDKKEELEPVPEKDKVQRKPIFESNAPPPPDEKNIQRKSDAASAAPASGAAPASSQTTASPSVESGISSSKGSGQPLPADTRSQMENAVGADFSGVRIHNDSKAAELSNSLDAQAFTHGNDIYFNAGKYDAGSSEGRHLLAHELTHTVQQGASLRRKANDVPASPAPAANPAIPATQGSAPASPAAPRTVSSEIVDISQGTFSPSETVKKEIEDAKHIKGGLDVRVKTGPYAGPGTVKVRKDGDSFNSINQVYLPLTNVWLQKIPGLSLRTDIKKNVVTGYVTTKGADSAMAWINALRKAEEAIGLGFHFKKTPLPAQNIINKLENGTLSLGFTDFTITIGGFFDLKLNLTLENLKTPVFDGSATMKLKGAEGTVNVDNKQQGMLGGSGSLAINFQKFTGLLEVKYDPLTGLVDIHGKAGYSGDKLSGSIDLVSTDIKTANNFAKDAIKAAGGVEKAQEAAPPAAVPAPTGTSDRGLAGVGQLEFHLTDWFAGTVNVIVDADGHVTVIGKIAPPAEITLFKQKDWDNELIKFEAKAYYGIPVIGNLNLFANISLHTIAKLGPAKIYNIEIMGTYSTDPTVQKSIQIAGSINISGYAGLRLRAEGGAGIELARHDLKFGIGLNADVGVQAYADARPTIGWREPGEFFISGTLELVAQPMLGLGGDFFIKLETPWWSPLSDHTWTWPLFSKQWPLGDPIGLNAEVKDYVLGSGKVPEIVFKPPQFDPQKFMTNMVDDNLPDKAGGKDSGQSGFKEDGSVHKPELPDPKKEKKDKEEKGKPKDKKGGTPEKPAKAKPDAKPDPEIVKIFELAGKQLQGIKDPITRADLNAKLAAIEKAVPGIKFDVHLEGEKWVVASHANKHPNPHPVRFGAILTDADKKAGGKTIPVIADFTYTDSNVTMHNEKHTIIVHVKNGVFQVLMRSDEIDLRNSAIEARSELLKKLNKAPNKITAEKIIKELGDLIEEIRDLHSTITIKLGETKAPGVETAQLAKELTAIEISKMEAKLKDIGIRSGADSLKDLVARKIPSHRYLPIPGKDTPSGYIRGIFYEGMFSGDWKQKRKDIMKRDWTTPNVPARIDKAKKNKDSVEWAALIRDSLIDYDADINTYDHTKVEYAVDHIDPVANMWNTEGNKKDDDKRKYQLLNDKNLRYVTKRSNSSKASDGATFDKFVLIGFLSSAAEANNPEARTLKGDSFLKADGTPI